MATPLPRYHTRTMAAPQPRPGSIVFPDPRPCAEGGEIGVIGFYSPGYDEPWDKQCGAGFLGNFWDLGPAGVQLEAKSLPGVVLSFRNTEAAFQALKWWKDHGAEFENLSGNDAFRLKKRLAGSEDFTYGGFGGNWQGMLAVLRAKFRPGSPMARALLETGEDFLQEHNAKEGRDKVWSDNLRGDGTNWLGLQLMLLRDELRGSPGSWSKFICQDCAVNVENGGHFTDAGKARWLAAVSSAAQAIRDQRNWRRKPSFLKNLIGFLCGVLLTGGVLGWFLRQIGS